MTELTPGQLAVLAIEVIGPGPGWNANLEVRLPTCIVTGAEISDLFQRGLMTAAPAPPPHDEEFDENAGSIMLDHIWTATPAGHDARLVAMTASQPLLRALEPVSEK